MTLGLHIAAHDAERAKGFSLFHEETRDNGVVRLFTRYEDIGRLLIKTEGTCTIVKGNAIPRNDDSAAKATEVALNKGHHITFPIGRAEIDCTAAVRIDGARHFGVFRKTLGTTISISIA